MDETLCDTLAANNFAKSQMAKALNTRISPDINGEQFADAYVRGIYREWSANQAIRYEEKVNALSEADYRILLIQDLLQDMGFDDISYSQARDFLSLFDRERLKAFNFYPGIQDFLSQAKQHFTLVVITNGPEHSQVPKVEKIKLKNYVDHILIGGQEPAQKPARSIFEKALTLATCKAHEAIHVGDSLAADIVGATNCGITSIWVQHQQTLDPQLSIAPSYTITHPNEMAQTVQQISGKRFCC